MSISQVLVHSSNILFFFFIYRPQRKVMLCYNPRPEDANEFGPVMGDDFEVKIIAMVSDEHAQVVSILY